MLEKIRSYYCQRTFNYIEQIIIVCYDKDFMEVGRINKTNGKLNEVQINLSVTFRKISKFVGAKYIIVTHNHPKTVHLYPSLDDIKSTREILQFCKKYGIELYDDVIYNEFSTFSFKENGLL